MTLAPASLRQRTAWSKASGLATPLAKRSAAPGARSCTIPRMAVPSAPLPALHPDGTETAGRSPVAWEAASESRPSEITPTVTPVPSMPSART